MAFLPILLDEKSYEVYYNRKIPNGCSMECNCHQFFYLPLIFLGVLPKVRYFVTFFVPTSICVEAYAALGSIMVITICECSDANRRFFSLKNHWLIQVIRNVYNEMTPGKAKTGSPKRLHLRHVLDGG
jgi:hypothetical protein